MACFMKINRSVLYWVLAKPMTLVSVCFIQKLDFIQNKVGYYLPFIKTNMIKRSMESVLSLPEPLSASASVMEYYYLSEYIHFDGGFFSYHYMQF